MRAPPPRSAETLGPRRRAHTGRGGARPPQHANAEAARRSRLATKLTFDCTTKKQGPARATETRHRNFCIFNESSRVVRGGILRPILHCAHGGARNGFGGASISMRSPKKSEEGVGRDVVLVARQAPLHHHVRLQLSRDAGHRARRGVHLLKPRLRKRLAVRSDVTSNGPSTVCKIVRSAGRTSWTSRRLPVRVIVFFDQNGLFVEPGCANLCCVH